MGDVAGVVEILAPEVSEKEVVAEIEKRIGQRRAEAQAEGWDYDRLVEGQAENFRTSGRFASELYFDLHQIRMGADGIKVSLSLQKSRVPLLGGLFTRLRRELHNLVIYYVNILAGRQAVLNRAVANVLSQLVDDLDESQDQVTALEAEVATLRQRLEALEKILVTRAQGHR